MAQPPKIPVIANTGQLAPSRYVPPAASAAEYNPYVEPAAAGTGVMLNGAEFSYEQPRHNYGFAYDPRREQRSFPQSWSLIQTPSETFARILENMAAGVEGASDSVRGSAKRFQDVISRAIATYEANAKIIHGETVLIGGAVSFRL
ncbi:MAG: hypothetical protein FJX37_06900 [Alphaproteobacteria bacterium]|nr:hypothetical protein [Alphaproteobacteria bacterium]MBM3950936.1 hypothetical protein [Rhodospirillales bacterium]